MLITQQVAEKDRYFLRIKSKAAEVTRQGKTLDEWSERLTEIRAGTW